MATLEELQPGVHIKGLLPGKLVTLIEVKPYGANVVEVTYKDDSGLPGMMLLYQQDAARLEIASHELPWSFDADGTLFLLVSEAYRISLAYLFDPLIPVHTSLIQPLPHQITAVYETMLTKQPLRYLLTDFSARYIYLPLLKNTDVLFEAIQKGVASEHWQQENFAYAERWDVEHHRFLGLKARQRVQIALDASSVLVKPEVALAQMAAQEAAAAQAWMETENTYRVSTTHTGSTLNERGGTTTGDSPVIIQTPIPPSISNGPGYDTS